jgi:hypothetical protein
MRSLPDTTHIQQTTVCVGLLLGGSLIVSIHVMARHRSKIELMPNSFLTENNGLWMANYPEVYARVISPSNENSVQARIEVLEFLTKANHTAKTKEQCILGWKCSKELIKGTAEDDVSETQPRIYSA